MPLHRPPRVALLIESSIAYGREILEGIADYVRTHDPWSMFVERRELSAEPPGWLARGRWDGLISRVTTPALAKLCSRLKVPAVNLDDRQPEGALPAIRSDDQAIGRLAAEHLLERGFRSFAYCTFAGEDWAEKRLAGFVAATEERGCECACYASYWDGPLALPWDEEEERIAKWLRGLPRPLGVAACNDFRGQHVLEACRRAKLSAPEEAAVIGVDNDEQLCRLCDPPLSTVAPNARRVGQAAAELLDQLMQGGRPPEQTMLIPPLGIVPRTSTDVLAIDDDDVATAVRFIREHACQGIRVSDILKKVPISRSLLERKFRALIGRTPHAEIRLVQLRRVRELLTETDLPLKQITQLSGFSHLEYLSYYFKQATGLAPGEYRRSHGRRASAETLRDKKMKIP